jgi:sporulation protein YlmC with PRC-barrel domain
MKNKNLEIKVKKVAIALIKHFLQTGETITYGELCELVDFKVCPIRMGAYLGHVSEICIENDMPIITALVVNKGENICSDSFFKCYFPNEKNKESFLKKYYEKIRKEPGWEMLFYDLNKSLKNAE